MTPSILEAVLLLQSLVIQCRYLGLCRPRFDFYAHPGCSNFFFVVHDMQAYGESLGNVIYKPFDEPVWSNDSSEAHYIAALQQCIDYLTTQLRDYHASGDHTSGELYLNLSLQDSTPPPEPPAINNLDLFSTPFLCQQAV